jgi:hypothetical protein
MSTRRADRAAALEPGQPVGHRGRGHLDPPGQRPLRLARVFGQRPQQGQVEVVQVGGGHRRGGHLGQLGERS